MRTDGRTDGQTDWLAQKDGLGEAKNGFSQFFANAPKWSAGVLKDTSMQFYVEIDSEKLCVPSGFVIRMQDEILMSRQTNIKCCIAVSWLRRLVLSCSPRRPGFITWTTWKSWNAHFGTTVISQDCIHEQIKSKVLRILAKFRILYISPLPPKLEDWSR